MSFVVSRSLFKTQDGNKYIAKVMTSYVKYAYTASKRKKKLLHREDSTIAVKSM